LAKPLVSSWLAFSFIGIPKSFASHEVYLSRSVAASLIIKLVSVYPDEPCKLVTDKLRNQELAK
jgi:hypothetical protein